MNDANSTTPRIAKRGMRWWPGIALVLIALALAVWVRMQAEWPFQKRNLTTAQIAIVTGMLLLLWWTSLSRAPKQLRLAITFGLVGVAALGATLFRLRGVTGDMLPILEFRWAKPTTPTASPPAAAVTPVSDMQLSNVRSDFPQFLGPERNGVLAGPLLQTNWNTHPPELVWRRPTGAAWSGFAIVGNVCLTQEQREGNECVVAADLRTGEPIWSYANPAHFNTTIAGEGPRATPTVVSNRVFASAPLVC